MFSKLIDCRDIDEEEMNNYINEKLADFPIQKFLQEICLNHLLWGYDAISLYPSAMSDPKSIFPRIETGFVYTKDMNNDLPEKFNNQTFTQGSAILTTT